jgi:hypothetical protein
VVKRCILPPSRAGGLAGTGRLMRRHELVGARADQIAAAHLLERLAQQRPVVGVVIAQERLAQPALPQPLIASTLSLPPRRTPRPAPPKAGLPKLAHANYRLLWNGRHVACWHIASFRCDAEFSRYRGQADIDHARPSISIYEPAPGPRGHATASIRRDARRRRPRRCGPESVNRPSWPARRRPTCILLPWTPDYRWLLDRDDSPWYPTMRLFRQTATRDYASVLDRGAKRAA